MSLEVVHSQGFVHVQRIFTGLLDQHGVPVQSVSLSQTCASLDISPFVVMSECQLLSTEVGRRSLDEQSAPILLASD